MSIIISNCEVLDIRVPTSDTLLGSDPFHKKPNYSVVMTRLNTNTNLTGISVSFTIGAGNDWMVYCVKDLCKLLKNKSINEFIDNPGLFYSIFNDHHQLRWLADGIARMAIGSVINALWDLWAKKEKKPLWKLLVDLEPQKIVDCIDWRYISDALTPSGALEILQTGQNKNLDRENSLKNKGPKAYSTAGWLGLTDEQIMVTIKNVKALGFNCFKMKVGENLHQDIKRLSFIRKSIDPEDFLMLDANQIWGVDEAINYMMNLLEFKPIWIEEPIARDDVLGFQKVSKALKPYNIGVACGEQVPSIIIFKQLLQSDSIQYCQIDATRLGGVNDVMAVILMAAKYHVPICPHGGGIGLCNMIIHYAIWDQICVSGPSKNQFVEYLDFLQNNVFINPIEIHGGSYKVPKHHGWGLEMHEHFIKSHIFPEGDVWKGRESSGNITFLG